MVMTKKEFKERWDSDADGGGITVTDIADCAVAWGICSKPRIMPLDDVIHKVTVAAGCADIYEDITTGNLERM